MKDFSNYHDVYRRRVSRNYSPQEQNQISKEMLRMQQYQYDAMYKVKYDEFIGRLSTYFHKHLPYQECTSKIEHQSFRKVSGAGYISGFMKRHSKNIVRKYLLDNDGIWYEVDRAENPSLGFPVTDETLEAFAVDIKHDYQYNKGNDIND
ncbi:hypothetical protein [Bacillus sp. SJS]|uniref:hypothetical protein n=1 Tax=Bacillus sp. SJS TaxID=1423321 RepID=UPI0004DCECB2|nr:hypothetical protein [Bacillus sp. SJS]KZZ85636.1 hypothetical protein AS29_003345 [Bacillus sp. SJS]